MFNVLKDEVIELFAEISYDNSAKSFSIKPSILLKDKSIFLDVFYINETDLNVFYENNSFNKQIFNLIVYFIEDKMRYSYCDEKIKLVSSILVNTPQKFTYTNFNIIDGNVIDVIEIHSQMNLFLSDLSQLDISLKLFIEDLKVEELFLSINIENSNVFATETDFKQYILDITLNNLIILFKYDDFLCNTLIANFKDNTHIYFENFYLKDGNLITTNTYQMLADNKNILNSQSSIFVKAENNDTFIKLIVTYFYKNNKSIALYKMIKSDFEYISKLSIENAIYNFLARKLNAFFPNFLDVTLIFDFTGFDFPSDNNNDTSILSFNKDIKNNEYFKKAFGEGLRQIRISRGETQEEFGEILSYSTSMIKKIELGKKSPSFDSLIHILHTLGIDINYFFS